MFLVAANTRQAIVGQKEWITTGSSGIQVQFLFSEDWDGLSKFAVFRNAEIEESVIPIALPESNLTELPAENCAAEYVDEKVYVGVYGSDGLGHIIIPTIWVSLGVLKEGAAYEGMDPPQPTPDMWAQILAIAQNAGAENAEAAEKAEAGAKEAASTAQAAAAEVKNLSVDADTLAAGEPATVEKTVDAGTGAVKLKFGIPQGPQGDPLTYEDLTEEQKAELVQGPILEAQTSAVAAVGSARTTAVNAVNQAGTTQTGAVNQAGANQVAAVNQAGATQAQAVEDKGAEVLDSIPQDYSDLAAEVDDLNRQISDVEDNQIPELKSTITDAGIYKSVDFSTAIQGHYINKNGAIDTSYNYAYTQPVAVKEGQTVIMRGSGVGGYITMIAAYNNGTYTSLITDNGTEVQDYTYNVPEDMYLVFSYNWTLEHSARIYYDVIANDKAIKGIFSTLGLSRKADFTSAVSGTFIGPNGAKQTSAGFSYLDNVNVKKGELISFTARGYNTNVAMIAINNGENQSYTPVVISIDSTVRTYTYVVPFDCIIALSYNNSYQHECVISVDVSKVAGDYESLFGHGVLFNRIAVIGDSLASGELVISGTGVDVYGDSWLSFLAKKMGSKARNHYSSGGLTCKMWLDTYLSKMQSDTASNAYFIALGTNDLFSEPYPLGTISDAAGTNTFVGWYKQIVEAVRSKAPNSVIFCVSTYNNTEIHHTYSTMISDIADLYDNCFYIDYIDNAAITTKTGSVWSDTGHFTTIGYNYVAGLIYQLVNDCVESNKAFFKFFGRYNLNDAQYDD